MRAFFLFLQCPFLLRKQKPNPSSNKIRWIIQTLISKEPPHWLWFEKERRDSRATNHLIFVVSNHVTQWVKNFRYATRTRNLMIRSHTLYPVELTGRGYYFSEWPNYVIQCDFSFFSRLKVVIQSFRVISHSKLLSRQTCSEIFVLRMLIFGILSLSLSHPSSSRRKRRRVVDDKILIRWWWVNQSS